MLRLGFVASFFSEPVLKGFIVGLALTILVGRIPKFFGVPKTESDFFEQAWGLITHVGDIQWLTALVGAMSLIVVLACKKWLAMVPGSLVAVLLGNAASATLLGVAAIGYFLAVAGQSDGSHAPFEIGAITTRFCIRGAPLVDDGAPRSLAGNRAIALHNCLHGILQNPRHHSACAAKVTPPIVCLTSAL